MEAQLKSELHQVEWDAIKPHLERDAVVVASQEMDIIEVAKAIVKDDTNSVKGWMDKGQVKKPSDDQISDWNKSPEKPFVFIIVQPYVLIQEMTN